MAETSAPDRASVLDVMQSCGCTESHAIHLLSYSNNDPEKAKRRHQALSKFMNLRAEQQSPSPPRPAELHLPKKVSVPNYQKRFSDHSSDEETYFDTPRTDEERLPDSKRTFRHGPDHDDRTKDRPTQFSGMLSKEIPSPLAQHSPTDFQPHLHRTPRSKSSNKSLKGRQKDKPTFSHDEPLDEEQVEPPYRVPEQIVKIPPRKPPKPGLRGQQRENSLIAHPELPGDPQEQAFGPPPLPPKPPKDFDRDYSKQPTGASSEEPENLIPKGSNTPSLLDFPDESNKEQPEETFTFLPRVPASVSTRTPIEEILHSSSASERAQEHRTEQSHQPRQESPGPVSQGVVDPSQPAESVVPPASSARYGLIHTQTPVESSPVRVVEKGAVIELPAQEPDYIHVDDLKSAILEEFVVEPEWDFHLPLIPAPSILTPGAGQGTDGFNLLDLVGAIQQGVSEQVIANYFGYYSHSVIRRHINDEIDNIPAMFFATATNNDWIVRTWIAYGGDVNAVHKDSRVPLLVFAIAHSETIQAETTDIVATLLSLGASPTAIPSVFYTPYCKDLPEDGPDNEELKSSDKDVRKWLTPAVKLKLTRTTNLTHRYNLERAVRTKKPSSRHWQVAVRKNAQALLGLPYFLIGQSMAANRLLQTCLSHLVIPGKRPLVMTFAGPSGHGKTELARRLGYLMSLELEVVDCTIVNREIELFGGRHPYVNADQGTPLNNFLARNSGRRCIVFLDEFEKTTKEIHQALLLPFDNGEYQDRRNLAKIDCSKTIWILATNALDTTIRSFCTLNEQVIFNDDDESQKLRLLKRLEKNLKDEFVSKFDAPITGRISAFLPFLVFSPQEQAVIAHKYLLELGRDVRAPVSLLPGVDERLIGNIRLRVRRDASVCRTIAEEGYHPDLGARSLITAVDSVRSLLVDSYLAVDELITEDDGLVDFVVDVNQGEIVANMGAKTPREEGEERE